ncbi:MAG: phage tail protein [Deltaproteobacteria bacterium]|nr:phage tail protein [Deltaproteobacteria bacterium]
MFAMLGDIIFDVLTSPETFKLSGDYTYAEHKVVEAPPLLQWLSNDLRKISMELGLHVAFTDPAAQMNALYAAADAHQALPLTFGNGVFRGYFVIESIEETHQHLADDGSFIAISARLELREWILGADAATSSTPSRPAAPPPGIVYTTPDQPTATPFDSAQPVSAANLLPVSAIMQLSNLGVPPGTTYSAAAYAQPGVSAIVGVGPGAAAPGNPNSVPTAVIVRIG